MNVRIKGQISLADIKYVLTAKEYRNPTIVSYTLAKNGVYAVVYAVRGTDGKKVKRCVFVSGRLIQKAKINRRIQASKTVNFAYVNATPDMRGLVLETETGHTVIIDRDAHKIECDCQDYGIVEVNGHKMCKHIIKSARASMDIANLSSLINWLDVAPMPIAA